VATPAVTPSPDQGTPGGGAGVGPADQQANPLQTALAKLAQVCQQMADQNPVVADDLMAARANFVSALQKTMMASQPQPAQNPTPQGQ
jgi:hypothetical protein